MIARQARDRPRRVPGSATRRGRAQDRPSPSPRQVDKARTVRQARDGPGTGQASPRRFDKTGRAQDRPRQTGNSDKPVASTGQTQSRPRQFDRTLTVRRARDGPRTGPDESSTVQQPGTGQDRPRQGFDNSTSQDGPGKSSTVQQVLIVRQGKSGPVKSRRVDNPVRVGTGPWPRTRRVHGKSQDRDEPG